LGRALKKFRILLQHYTLNGTCLLSIWVRFWQNIEFPNIVYNIDDYAKESKYRLEIAHKRARIIIEENKRKNIEFYDLKAKDIDIFMGDKVLLKNEIGHKLDSKYTGPYTVESLEVNENIRISNNKTKKETVHKDRLKTFIL